MPEQKHPGDAQKPDATPLGEVSIPLGEVPAPQGEVAAPQGEAAAPQGEVAAPQGEVAAPQGEVDDKPKKHLPARDFCALAALVLAIAFAVGDAALTARRAQLPPAIEVQATAEAALPEEGEAVEALAATAETAAAETATPEQARGGNWKDDAMPTDPSTWNAAALDLMNTLSADPYYAGFTATAVPDKPYLIAVNRAASCVTVYTVGNTGRYTVPYMAMVCSGGTDTPTGYYSSPINYGWRLLSGPCYGQYATRIWDAYLFHSVPYYTQHKDDLEYDQFNQLGTIASLGCIRLMVADVKWIYDNCPIGTPVIIYDDPQTPGPMGKPGTIYTDPADTTLRGWDPTDPDPVNPWPEEYRDGTTIRSDAAQLQWDRAQDAGAWAPSLNPTDLRGFSTDSSVEGVRG